MRIIDSLIKRRRSRFIRIFLSILFLVAVTIFILTWIISITFINVQKENIGKQHAMSLSLVSSFYEQMRYNEFPLLSQLFSTKEIQDYLFHRTDNKYAAVINIQPIIERIVGQNFYLHSIYLYNGDYGYYSSYAGYEKDVCKSNPDIEEFIYSDFDKATNLSLRRSEFVNTSGYDLSSKMENLYSLKITHLSDNPNNTYSLIVNISEDVSRQFFTSNIKEFEQSFYVIDKNNTFLSHPDKAMFATQIPKNSLYEAIAAFEGPSGIRTIKKDGKAYYISWVDQSVMGWRFIYIIPYSAIIHALLQVVRLIVAIVFFILLLASGIGAFVSKKLDNSLSYERRLTSYIKGESPYVRILKDETVLYSIALLKFTFSKEQLSNLDKEERENLKQKVIRASENLVLHKTFGLILQVEKNMYLCISSLMPDELFDRLNRLISIVKTDFEIEMSALVSQNKVIDKELSTEYPMLAREMKNQLLVNKDGVDYYRESDYRLPKFPYENINQSISERNVEKIQQCFDSMISALYESQSWVFFDLIKMNLVAGISLYMPEEIEMYYPGGLIRFINQINQIEEIEQMREICEKIVRIIEQINNDKINSENNEIVALIDEFIASSFADSLLNAAMIADHIGLSLNYTRAYYKMKTGKSLNDAIGEKRLRVASELLINTSISVNEIRSSVGFTNYPYFCTYFKNYFGSTPSSYRRFRGKTKKS